MPDFQDDSIRQDGTEITGGGGGGSGVVRGTTTVTITDGTAGLSGSIAHGLGSVPTAIVATARVTADTRDDYVVTTKRIDDDHFKVNVRGAAAEQFALANPTVVTVEWIAA